MAIEGVVADPGAGGSEFGGDNVSGGSGTVFIPYTKLMSGADGSTELIGGDAANGLDVDVTRVQGTVSVNVTGSTTTFPVSIAGTVGVNVTGSATTLPVSVSGTVGVSLSGSTTTLPVSLAGNQAVSINASSTTLPVSVAGNVGVTLNATTTNIGVTLAASLPAGTNAIGNVSVTGVTVVSSLTSLTGGAVAHDAADSGNPIKIGLKAESSLSGATMVADGDRTDAYADLDGVQIVKNGTPWGDLLSERQADTAGTSNAFTTFGATASARNMITQVTIHNSHATTNGYVDFRDGTAGAIFFTFPAPATGGCVVHFDPPLRQPTANTALAYDVSAAISTIYISVNGYKSKV